MILKSQSNKRLSLNDNLTNSANKIPPLDRMMRMSQDLEFPIRILDNIISNEEHIYGFSLFNRGESLKKSLIDPQRVKNYVEQH